MDDDMLPWPLTNMDDDMLPWPLTNMDDDRLPWPLPYIIILCRVHLDLQLSACYGSDPKQIFFPS